MKWIDALLNKLTLYGFMLYFLIGLTALSIAFSFLGILPYNPLWMVVNVAVLYGTCKAVNPLFAKIFGVRENWESSAITGLILSLIVGPTVPLNQLWIVAVVAVVAMLSKYLLVWRRRHLFNPAAFAVVISAIVLNFGASWWVGILPLLPFVIIGGLLLMRKMRWLHLVVSFLAAYLVLQSLLFIYHASAIGLSTFIINTLLYSPIVFFSFVMLTEPLTMPTGKKGRITYGVLVAVVASALPLVWPVSYGLELSLLIANIVGLLIFGNTRRFLKLIGPEQFAKNSVAFKFTPDKPLKYQAGQYMLWSLPHKKTDMRGGRRYFTIASSPTEPFLMLITKFADQSSSFKTALRALPIGSEMMASGLDGNFVLPQDAGQHCVFIAGGIGIAPFRSMVKYLIETNGRQPITLLYSNNVAEEIGFKDLFDAAAQKFGLKTVYTLSNLDAIPPGWPGKTGYVTGAMIKAEVAGYQNALYYISGPDPMVRAMEKTLHELGIPRRKIKTDYFPGYA